MVQPNSSISVLPGKPNVGYLASIDGLRAVAVTLVILTHVARPHWFGGAVGLDVFFVLSGYLITTILMREHSSSKRINLRRFYVRRMIRLYPALIVAVVMLFIPGIIFAPMIRSYVLESLFALTYTTPIFMQLGVEASEAWGHTWTLGIEEMFYLIWPLMLLPLLRAGRPSHISCVAPMLLGTTMLVGAILLGASGYESYFLRAGGLFLGCGLAITLAHGKWTLALAQKWNVVGWAGVGLLSASVGILTADTDLGAPAVLLACLGSVMVIGCIVTVEGGALTRILGGRVMSHIGRISYELYLWHYPLIIIFEWATRLDPIVTSGLVILLSYGLALGTRAVLTPFIERWKLRVGQQP